jgi:hypothetical protein
MYHAFLLFLLQATNGQLISHHTVTWQGTNVKLPEDDRNVEVCSSI